MHSAPTSPGGRQRLPRPLGLGRQVLSPQQSSLLTQDCVGVFAADRVGAAGQVRAADLVAGRAGAGGARLAQPRAGHPHAGARLGAVAAPQAREHAAHGGGHHALEHRPARRRCTQRFGELVKALVRHVTYSIVRATPRPLFSTQRLVRTRASGCRPEWRRRGGPSQSPRCLRCLRSLNVPAK